MTSRGTPTLKNGVPRDELKNDRGRRWAVEGTFEKPRESWRLYKAHSSRSQRVGRHTLGRNSSECCDRQQNTAILQVSFLIDPVG